MRFAELSPAELFSEGFESPRLADRPWLVRWDTLRGDPAELVLRSLPETVEFATSGTTGPRRSWVRTRELLWAEAGMLAGLLAPHAVQGVLSFVHPAHLYGALTSVLVPARLGVPVWYRPQFAGQLPPEGGRWAVMAIPWIFSLLHRRIDWVHAAERVTVLHASGMIPMAAQHLQAAAGPERVHIVEVFGATESGGVATRQWSDGEPPDWTLLDDVAYADPPRDGETPLVVRSPRLASPAGSRQPTRCELDDHVERLDDRRFRFTGRRSRLVNINGRRVNLDELEDRARSVLTCADLALCPVTDDMIGEHVELLVVPHPPAGLADLDLAAAFSAIGVRPRRVRAVQRIDRTEIGKFRRVAPLAVAAGARS